MRRFTASVCAIGLLGIASGQNKKVPPPAAPPVSIGLAESVRKLEPVIITRASLDEKVITLRLSPRVSAELGIEVEESDGFSYVWRERRADEYPTREDFLTIAPALVETKARYGLPWFEQRWAALQLRLF